MQMYGFRHHKRRIKKHYVSSNLAVNLLADILDLYRLHNIIQNDRLGTRAEFVLGPRTSKTKHKLIGQDLTRFLK